MKGCVMKAFILTLILGCLLGACASKPKAFGPAYGSDFGYENTRLQQDRFRISYTSRGAYESRDLALYRAAQIADNEGYSHFEIIWSDYADNGPNPIRSKAGVLLGGGHSGPYVDVGVEDVVRAVEGPKVTETIEVILLSSDQPQNVNVYEAKSLLKNIVPPAAP